MTPAETAAPGRRRGLLALLGPGLITGASDDDPSGIATYSQTGAQFGYDLSWTMLFSYPLMAAIQQISARIGRVTGKGIAANIGEHYPPILLRMIVALLLAANVINLAADLGAMGDALHMVIGGPGRFYVVCFAVLCALLEIFVSYRRYVAILKWSTLALFAYVAAMLFVNVHWGEVVRHTLLPSVSWDSSYLVSIVAVLGTTISPYLFFWQASTEAEDERVDPHARPLRTAPQQAPAELRRIDWDTYVGMGLSNLIGLCILITAAATLHAHNVTDVGTSAQAAAALKPIAGEFAFFVFACGIIGTGLLAVPVLAGSAAYAVAEALRQPTGLSRTLFQAKAFYATIAFATLIGTGINFFSIDPMKALFWSAVINGFVAVPLMVVMMIMTMQPKVMGEFTLSRPLWVMGWLSTGAMGVTVIATLFA
ncbi:MAG TPA: Nramp family divalent metal transporter [Stellaceae bacterium]|nr:Nramp family divalent metal transporter [Stellaceae bacterium]